MAGLLSKLFVYHISTLFYFCVILNLTGITNVVSGAIFLGKNNVLQREKRIAGADDFSVYCYEGEAKVLANVWKTVHFRIVNLSPDDYKLFPGEDEHTVNQRYEASAQSWFQLLPWHWETVRLPVFNSSCVGVLAARSYVAKLEIIRVDYWRVLLFAAGLILYHFSPSLTKNVFFHYTTGVAFGVTASLLLLTYVISRYIPKKSAAAALLLSGWAFGLFLVQKVWYNLSTVVQAHQNYIVAYVCVAGVISFAVCYRYGPVENPKTLNLIKWLLQALGLTFIYLSSDWQEVSMAAVITMLITHNIPSSWTKACKTYWRRKFPPKIRLLSEEEYYHQASVETQKALNELRNYCQSPESSPWKVVTKLQSPIRFAEFVEGNSHLSDQEILEYETSLSFKVDQSTDSDSSNEYV